MHTGPMKETDGTFDDNWKPIKDLTIPCRYCHRSGGISYRIWESSCGGYEDYKYKCTHCEKTWWIEGIDA